jgi:hypothetical protein
MIQVWQAVSPLFIPVTIRPKITGKSMRYGAMSDLAWDPAVAYEEAVALGGWTTNSNRDYYVWQYLVAIVPSVLSLAGYPDCRVVPYAATLGILFHHDSLTGTERLTTRIFNKFVDKLYAINLPEFKVEKSPQRDMIVAVTAVMGMHFDDVYAAHGGNHCYVRKMHNAVMSCGVEAGMTAVGGMSLLQKWPKLVKDEFKRGNSDRQHPDSSVRRADLKEETMAKLGDSVAKMLAWKTEQQQVLQQMHDQQD